MQNAVDAAFRYTVPVDQTCIRTAKGHQLHKFGSRPTIRTNDQNFNKIQSVLSLFEILKELAYYDRNEFGKLNGVTSHQVIELVGLKQSLSRANYEFLTGA